MRTLGYLFLVLSTTPVLAVPVSRSILELKSQARIAEAKKFSAETNLDMAKQKTTQAEYERKSVTQRMQSGLATELEVSGAIVGLMEARISELTVTSTLEAETAALQSALMRLDWVQSGAEKPKQLAQLNATLAQSRLKHVEAVQAALAPLQRELASQLNYLKKQIANGTLDPLMLPSSEKLLAQANALATLMSDEHRAALASVVDANQDLAEYSP